MNGESHSHGGASALSTTSHNSPAPSLSSHPPSDVNTPNHDPIELDDSDSASDVDAEGTEDDDFAEQRPTTNGHVAIVNAPTPSTSSSSDESRKRKADVDEEELIRLNPDLYGLRRSVRISCPQFSDKGPSANIIIRDARDLNAQWYESFSPFESTSKCI